MNIKSRPDRWIELGTTDLESLSLKLREIFMKEVSGENRPLYEEFNPLLNDYTTEAHKFLQNGFFDNAFDDLMPLAIATALKACIHHNYYLWMSISSHICNSSSWSTN